MGLFKKKKTALELGNVCDGSVVDISEACDAMFAEKMMGDGVMILPQNGKIYSPCEADITMTFPTKHAIGLTLKNGVEILLHFGVDTVNLKGEGFRVCVAQGDHVQQGDLLWDADLNYIKTHAPSEALMCVITSMPEHMTFEKQLGIKKKGETIALLK